MTALNEKAVMVKLTITMWQNRSVDEKARHSVATVFNVQDKEDVYVKTLVPRHYTSRISRACIAARREHYDLTMPWLDEGQRILPCNMMFKYTQAMAVKRADFEAAVSNFLVAYPQAIETAKLQKGELFEETDYPTAAYLQTLYSYDIDMLPLPGTDFRLQSLNEDMEKLVRAQVSDTLVRTSRTAVQALRSRLFSRLAHLTEVLGMNKHFKDSTINLLKDEIDLVEQLNIMDDESLKGIVAKCRKQVLQHTPAVLRTNEQVRLDVYKNAMELKNVIQIAQSADLHAEPAEAEGQAEPA